MNLLADGLLFLWYFGSFSLTKNETNCPSIMLKTGITFEIFFHRRNISAWNAVLITLDNVNWRHSENKNNFFMILDGGNISNVVNYGKPDTKHGEIISGQDLKVKTICLQIKRKT